MTEAFKQQIEQEARQAVTELLEHRAGAGGTRCLAGRPVL